MQLSMFLSKKVLRSFDTTVEYNWYRWIDISKIHLAKEMVSIITIM